MREGLALEVSSSPESSARNFCPTASKASAGPDEIHSSAEGGAQDRPVLPPDRSRGAYVDL